MKQVGLRYKRGHTLEGRPQTAVWWLSMPTLVSSALGGASGGVVEELQDRVDGLAAIVTRLIERLPQSEWMDVLGITDREIVEVREEP
jgi:hypothetical protein